MYAKYIKRELPDLNGTGQTQACYQMQLRPMNFKTFVAQGNWSLAHDGISGTAQVRTRPLVGHYQHRSPQPEILHPAQEKITN